MRQVSSGQAEEEEDGEEQDWCPPTPAPVRDLLPNPLTVARAVALEIETHVKKITKTADVKPALGKEDIMNLRKTEKLK